jgi:hypothetical protein
MLLIGLRKLSTANSQLPKILEVWIGGWELEAKSRKPGWELDYAHRDRRLPVGVLGVARGDAAEGGCARTSEKG